MDWVEVLIVAAIVLLIAAAGCGAYGESLRPDMMLKKDDWQCTNSKTRTNLQLVGKVLVPITMKVCMEYRRIDGNG